MPLVLTEGTGITLTPGGGNLVAETSAAELLTLIKTVDGASSGLDADLLDGQHASDFATAAQGILAASALQSGDIDYVTNANGSYVRFASGWQIIWTTKSVAMTINTASSYGGFISPVQQWTYPATFSGTPPAGFANTRETDGVSVNVIPGTTSGTYYVRSITSQSSASRTVQLMAIGPWA